MRVCVCVCACVAVLLYTSWRHIQNKPILEQQFLDAVQLLQTKQCSGNLAHLSADGATQISQTPVSEMRVPLKGA